ncbi:MAG: alpha/beta fold hydrolase, partial [Acidimicrobiales bacterium]
VQVDIVDADPDGIGQIVITSFRGARSYLGTEIGAAQRISDAGDGLTTYRTGDQGRFRPDGLLELRGRADHMVKIRGQRADLTEVEVAMRNLPEVRSAAVGLRSVDGGDRLVAWFVPTDVGWSIPELRRALRKRLPGYMVPGAFVALEDLPRTTRGKLDRASLPDPQPGRPDLGHAYEPPVGATEQLVAGAFATVLDIQPIGRHDSFFDLGGDSLLAAELMVRLAVELGRETPLSALLDAETPASLAVQLQHRARVPGSLVVLQPEGRRPPLYCIHGGGGEVLAFAALATRLGTDRPFIGVQLRANDPARVLFSLTRLARRYAAEILEHGGGRPCVLAGHSYGGVLAFEVTRLLREAGVTVTACALLDVGVPSRRPILGPRPDRTLAPGEDPLRRWKELAYLAHAAAGRRPRPERLLTERMNAAIWGMSRYRPVPIDVALVVVRAQASPPGRDLGAWAAFSTAGCTVLDVGGDHNTLLNPPHLHGLADDLLAVLEPLDPPAG